VISVYLRGHGDSDKPQTPYTVCGFADDVAWLCGELGVAKPIVIGHSMGGMTALEIAARYPELPSAIVAWSGAGAGGSSAPLAGAAGGASTALPAGRGAGGSVSTGGSRQHSVSGLGRARGGRNRSNTAARRTARGAVKVGVSCGEWPGKSPGSRLVCGYMSMPTTIAWPLSIS